MQENYENQYEEENLPPIEDSPSVVDRIIGVFTSPAALFEKLAARKPKFTDWLIPVLVASVIMVLSTFLQMNDPEIVEQIFETQMEKMEEQFESMIEKGWMTEEIATQTMADMEENFSEDNLKSGAYSSIISVPLFLLIKLLLGALIYFIIARYILKGQGGYSQALTVYGTTFYIAAAQALVVLLIMLVTGKISTGTNVSALGGFDNTTMLGFLLSKVDIFGLLIVYTVGVGLSKMYHSATSGKYIAAVMAFWLGGTFILFLLGNVFGFFYDLAAGF